jgi:hypothetical protein
MLAQDPPSFPDSGPPLPPPADEPEAALARAWHARLRPCDAAEQAAVETLVAGVRRRARLDGLEERVVEALGAGTLQALPVLGALLRCRARIERDRTLALAELRMLRGLRPERGTRPAGEPAAPPAAEAAPPAARPGPAPAPDPAPREAHAAPEPPAPLPPLADPLGRAIRAAFPGLGRDPARRPDWRASTSRYALEAGLIAAGAG